MATRPTLKVAVPETLNKASDYNNNFDLMMQFVDDSIAESKDYVDDFMPSPSGNSGKFLTSNGSEIVYTYSVPIGGIMFTSTATAPANFLICDGSAISKETYATLYSVIGTTYGEPDSTKFRVPALLERYYFGGTTGTMASPVTETTGATNADHTHWYSFGAGGGTQTGGQSNTHSHNYTKGVYGVSLLPVIRYQ